MRYKTGGDKYQTTMLPACIEDYVPEDHMCRVIEAFTNQLDMVQLEYKYAECNEMGNRPFDPRMMLNLYIYGYLNRVRSSRKLEAETVRNIEVIWLMNGLTPDDKTISNFRKDNTKAIKTTFRAFSRMFRDLGMFGGEVEATDGVKLRANNSRKNNHNKTTVERELSRIDKRINEYMNALEQADKEEEAEEKNRPTAEEVKVALEKLNERKVKFEDLLARVEEEGEVSTVDPDSRLMHSGGDNRKLDVCYNVQTITDGKHHLIVDFDVTNQPEDKGNLENMSEKAKEVLEVETLTNLADKGYYDGEDIEKCENNGVTCLIAKPKAGGAKKEEGFCRENFVYCPEKDAYICPCQNELSFMRLQNHSDGKEYRVYSNFSACNKCPQREICTKSRFRQILRSPYQETLDEVDKRTRENKGLYRKRQEIVEHPFGTVKAVWGYKQFLCRGKEKVTAETALAYLAYNLKRVINIFKADGRNLKAALPA